MPKNFNPPRTLQMTGKHDTTRAAAQLALRECGMTCDVCGSLQRNAGNPPLCVRCQKWYHEAIKYFIYGSNGRYIKN